MKRGACCIYLRCAIVVLCIITFTSFSKFGSYLKILVVQAVVVEHFHEPEALQSFVAAGLSRRKHCDRLLHEL